MLGKSPSQIGEFLDATGIIKTLHCFFRRLHLVTIIQHLHSVGIHHHDLKCSNIVRRPDGALVVIDFDFAALGEDYGAEDCEDWVWLESGSSLRRHMAVIFLIQH